VGAFGSFEPDGLLRFALQNRCLLFDRPWRHHIDDFCADKITAAHFAIDGYVEQGQIAMVLR